MKLPDTIRRMLFTAALAVTIALPSHLHAAAVEDTGLPAPLPEWKTSAQLKQWRAETTAKTLAKEAADREAQVKGVANSATPSGFYTGKPYMAESGSYAFQYRDYNPEMARWTTVDPSGFPDGPNNRLYAAVPTSEFDDDGLKVWYTTSTQDISSKASSQLSSKINSYVTGLGNLVNSLVNTGMTSGGFSWASWSINNFTLTGSASGKGFGTTAWGKIGVPMTASYTLPSGLQPSQMDGTIGTNPKSPSKISYDDINNSTSINGNLTLINPISKLDTGVKKLGQEIYIDVTNVKLNYSFKLSFDASVEYE